MPTQPRNRSVSERINELAAAQQGAVSRPQLLAAGISPSEVKTRLRDGRLIAVHRGVYLVASPVRPPLAEEMAAVLACGERSAISRWDSVRLMALPLAATRRRTAGAPIHVSVAGPHRLAREGLWIHNTRTLRRSDIAYVERVPVTNAARTICDLAATATTRELERLIAEAAYRELVSEDELARRVRRSSVPGISKLRAILADPDGPRLTRSEGEEALLSMISNAGLPRPLTNKRIRGREFDFVWPAERLVVELDSRSAHERRKTRRSDQEKRRLLVFAGFELIRVDGDELAGKRDEVLAVIAAALSRSKAAA